MTEGETGIAENETAEMDGTKPTAWGAVRCAPEAGANSASVVTTLQQNLCPIGVVTLYNTTWKSL